MKHIYYKNDFAVEITLLNASGEVVSPPEWQWHIEFTDGRRKYICSVDKGNANVVGNTIMCYIDNHKFCCGEVGYKFVQAIPDLNYLDGFQNLITPKALPIELWEQESDNDINIQSSVVPAYVVYDAYLTAKANGYTGTAEEYYNALNHIVDIDKKEAERVEAEANRVTAEQQRVENFAAMESALTTATSKANTATTKAEEATKRADNSATAASQASVKATLAANGANAAAAQATQAMEKTNKATELANTATANANASAVNAGNAATEANEATKSANDATEKAKTATTSAEQSAERANTAADNADVATSNATQATTQATTATKRANDISADLEAKREADYWRGAKGEKGDKGDTGEKGDRGEKGDQGERGLQGVQGVKGDDGVSPTVTTSKTGKVTTIEITDAQGTHTATVNDGDSVEVVQSTGTSTTAVMSQKAVSDAIAAEKTRAKEAEKNLDNKVTDLEARMVDSSAHIGDDDKIILNQPLVDLIGVEGVDYTVIENMKFSAWSGNIAAATGNYLILVTMKKSILSYRGLTISGWKGWWTADVKPSASNPNVDEDGNDVTYTKGYYDSGERSNVSVAKPYLLFDAGTDVTNFVMAFLTLIPPTIYDIKSLNGGIRIVSSSIDGVGDKTMQLLKHGIATKHNSLDTTCVLNGMNFSSKSPFSLMNAEGSIYLQPIPIGAKNVLVRGLRATGTYTHHRIFVLDENYTILANDNHSGATVDNQYLSLENVTGAKYLAFNASGAEVASAIEEVLVLYDVPKDYDYWLAYNNYFDGEKAMLDIPYETSGIKNCMTYANLILKSNYGFDFLCEGITERYATFIFPDGNYNTTADTLVQYDENDNVLKSDSLGSVTKTNFGKSDTALAQIRLVEGCVKLKYRFVSKLELSKLSLEEFIARGNKVILSNRTVEWDNNWVKSINGIPLNINAYSPLKGKLICCMGDSITDFGSSSADGSWAWYIQRNYDCGVANYGRGSAHFCDVANTDPTADTNPGAFSTSTTPNNVVSTQVRWCIRELTADNITPDAIVLTGLTNDAFSTVNLGDIDTALAAYPMTADEVHTDFYGAAVYMVSKLRTAWPQVKVFFATPPRSLNPTQMQRLVEYVEAMRNVAKALGCGVIDFFDESLVEYPKATYNASTETWTHDNPMYNTNDILHPSQLGVNIMGQLASAKLIEYLK